MLDQFEKLGGRSVTAKSNFHLKTFIYEVGAFDLGYLGNRFTWCNKRGGSTNIRERLDKTLVSPD